MTAGTPALTASLAHAGLKFSGKHRVSPGTVVFHDLSRPARGGSAPLAFSAVNWFRKVLLDDCACRVLNSIFQQFPARAASTTCWLPTSRSSPRRSCSPASSGESDRAGPSHAASLSLLTENSYARPELGHGLGQPCANAARSVTRSPGSSRWMPAPRHPVATGVEVIFHAPCLCRMEIHA